MIILLIFYFPLILKLFGFLSRLEKKIEFLPDIIGRIEYLLSPFRDQIVSYFLLGCGIYSLVFQANFLIGVLFFFTFIFSRLNWMHRQRFRLNFCRSVLKYEEIEPNNFFKIYYQGLGSFSNPIPTALPTVSYSSLDCRTGNPPRKTIKPLLKGMIDTFTLAKLAILAMKKLSPAEGIDAFDLFARMWGSRFVARANLKLSTLGMEKLPSLHGKILLVFNHKSYLDFALNFFALGGIRNGSRHLRPRFIAAKDHFIDNPLIYSWIGVGKCIERAKMIFINRKKGRGWLAMQEASEKLIGGDVEVAVYPQGTRAWAMNDEKGERRDAGYYTTFTKRTFEDPLGHLKIGTSQLILDTVLFLQEKKQEPLTVVFIGINGTATVGPKKSFRIQTESEVQFQIGNTWKVELPENLSLENPKGRTASNESQKNYLTLLDQFQKRVDRELEQAIRWNENLIERFLTSPLTPLLCKERGDAQLLKDFLTSAHQAHNNLPFMILDRIYTLPANQWEKHLRSFQELIDSGASQNQWEELNRVVSIELLQVR